MSNKDIYNKLIEMISPICRDEEELSAIPVYVKTDKYRKKIIDFLSIAKDKGDKIDGDQLMILAIIMSNEEEQEYHGQKVDKK